MAAPAEVTAQDLAELAKIVDVGWTLVATTLVFLMQGGFMMLEIGAVREKNAKSSLVKKIIQIGVSTMSWWIVGFPLAYCSVPWDPNHYSRVFSEGGVDWTFVIRSWSLCATSTTIISGCIAERTTLKAYVAICLVQCVVVYPLVVRAVWSKQAFLRNNELLPWLKFEDFAGGAVVHMLGGVAGLVFAWRVGPRVGRFRNKERERLVYSMEPHSVFLMGAGTIVLWFGWYGLCGGATRGLSHGGALAASHVFMTTSLSPAAASLAVTGMTFFRKKKSTVEPSTLCNSALAGLVSITASAASVDAWAAMVIGFLGGLVMLAARKLLERLGVDDPLGAFAVHGACGAWGTLAVGIFGAPWSAHPASASQLASQLVGVSAIAAWTAVVVLFALLVLERLIPLRVTLEQELRGLDEELFRGKKVGSEKTSPEGRVAIVVTDVQGSTSLWAFDQRAMAQAIAIHDDIMRLEMANYSGYEIGTEGDAFQIAFSATIDALGFCISVQKRLIEARWPAQILEHEDAQPLSVGDQEVFNGLRVRMGVDVGICKRVVHQTSRTFRYVGVAMDTAKLLVDCLPSGGVVAVTHRTLEEMGPRIAKMGGLLSVCDLGTHLMKATSPAVAVFAVTHQDVAMRIPLIKPLETHAMVRMGYLDAPAVRGMHGLLQQRLLDVSEDHHTINRRMSGLSGGFAFGATPKPKKLDMRPVDDVVICFASLVDLESLAVVKAPKLSATKGGKGSVQDLPEASYESESGRPRHSDNSGSTPSVEVHFEVPSFERKCSGKSVASRKTSRDWSNSISPLEIAGGGESTSPAGMREAMCSAGGLARTALWQLNGYECKEDKYVFMTAFENAGQAVQWASTVARKINDEFPDRVSFACGLHAGLPTEVKPNNATGRADYYGTLVNTAARIHALARKAAEKEKASAVYVSQTLREEPEASIDSFVYSSEGSHLLKGLKTPVDIYSVEGKASPCLDEHLFHVESQECLSPSGAHMAMTFSGRSPRRSLLSQGLRRSISPQTPKSTGTDEEQPEDLKDLFLWGATYSVGWHDIGAGPVLHDKC